MTASGIRFISCLWKEKHKKVVPNEQQQTDEPTNVTHICVYDIIYKLYIKNETHATHTHTWCAVYAD